PDDVWAVGDRGTIVRSRDGETFAQVTSPTTARLTRIWGASPTSIWMTGDQGTVIEWDGSKFVTWPKLSNDVQSIWGTSRNDIWATAWYPYHFDGSAWTQLPLFESSNTVTAVWPSGPDRVFLLGASDRIYDYQPSTGRWTKTTVYGTQLLWGSDPGNLWTSGSPGDGSHFDGTTWTFYRTDDMYDLWGSGRDNVWGVGFLGMIIHRGAGDALWDQRAQNMRMTQNDLYGVHGANATDVFAVGEFGTILRRKR
ncbi:MAG TPA: hypothetical protein VN903_37450, partial [Polyangia bacterium]|nr:hypothetical protein [Polyangia bacterium]